MWDKSFYALLSFGDESVESHLNATVPAARFDSARMMLKALHSDSEKASITKTTKEYLHIRGCFVVFVIEGRAGQPAG